MAAIVVICLLLKTNNVITNNDSAVYKDSRTGIIFESNPDFVIQQGPHSDLIIRLNPKIRNIVGFQGNIDFIENNTNFSFENPFMGQFFFDSRLEKWRHVGPEGEDDSRDFIIGKTIAGDNIYNFHSGDAGGVERDYFIIKNDNSSVVRLIMGTDEQPGVDEEIGTTPTERDEQRQKLETQFLEMVKSVIFP